MGCWTWIKEHFDDIFRDPYEDEHKNKNESRSLYYFRVFSIFVAAVVLIIYFVQGVIGIVSDTPTIQTTYSQVDSLLVPDIYITYTKPFKMGCAFENLNTHNLSQVNCPRYLTNYTDPILSVFTWKFSPKVDRISLYPHNPNDTVNLNQVTLVISLLEIPPPTSFIGVSVYDPEYFSQPGSLTAEQMNPNQALLLTSIRDSNSHRVTIYQYSELRYTRNSKQVLQSKLRGDFGFTDSDTIQYVETSVERWPLPQNISVITIFPQTYISKDEKEVRANTALTFLGFVGGTKSLITEVYILVFAIIIRKSLKHPHHHHHHHDDDDHHDNHDGADNTKVVGTANEKDTNV